jgi:hypothetical protein
MMRHLHSKKYHKSVSEVSINKASNDNVAIKTTIRASYQQRANLKHDEIYHGETHQL